MWYYLVLFLMTDAILIPNLPTFECPPENIDIYDALWVGFNPRPGPVSGQQSMKSRHRVKPSRMNHESNYSYSFSRPMVAKGQRWTIIRVRLELKRVRLAELTLEEEYRGVIYQGSRQGSIPWTWFVWDVDVFVWGTINMTVVAYPYNPKYPDGMRLRKFLVDRCFDIGWCHWYSWSECSVTCGKGVAYRKRTCLCPNPEPDRFACPPGGKIHSRRCNTTYCCPSIINWDTRTAIIIKIRNNKGTIGAWYSKIVLKGSGAFVTLLNNGNNSQYLQVVFKKVEKLLAIKMRTKLANMITVKMFAAKLPLDQVVRRIPRRHIGKYRWNRQNFPFGPEGVGPVKEVRLEFGYTTDKIDVKGLKITVCSHM